MSSSASYIGVPLLRQTSEGQWEASVAVSHDKSEYTPEHERLEQDSLLGKKRSNKRSVEKSTTSAKGERNELAKQKTKRGRSGTYMLVCGVCEEHAEEEHVDRRRRQSRERKSRKRRRRRRERREANRRVRRRRRRRSCIFCTHS
jgi:hypothetical protein